MTTQLPSYEQIIDGATKGKMSCRPGFYAGRGPISCDLNNEYLELIHSFIKKEASEKHAANFVAFVNDQGDMSATAFLVAFQQFVAQGLEAKKIKRNKKDGTTLSAQGPAIMGEAFGCVMSALGQAGRSEENLQAASFQLKAMFLQNHKKELKVPIKNAKGLTEYGWPAHSRKW